MTPDELKQSADEMVEMFRIEVSTSDLHLPEFISGISCADGSDEYKKAYGEEELQLSISCAIAHCKRVIEVLEGSTPGTYTNYLFKKHRLILSELEGRVK